MSKKPDGPSFFEKLATAIVDRRNLIFFLYLCAMIFCAISLLMATRASFT